MWHELGSGCGRRTVRCPFHGSYHVLPGLFFFCQAQARQAERRIQRNHAKILCQGVKLISTLQYHVKKNVSVGDKHEIWNNLKMTRGETKVIPKPLWYWQGREKALCFRWWFSVTIFGDDLPQFSVMISVTIFGDGSRENSNSLAKLGRWIAVYAQDYLCQMGVVGSEHDKHHQMLLLTIVVEVFRAAYEIPILEFKFLFQTELVS